MLFTQPMYVSEELCHEKPIQDLSQIHCGPCSGVAFVGDVYLKQLRDELPSSPVLRRIEDPEQTDLEKQTQIDAARRVIERFTPAAAKLFCKEERFWYYLGQSAKPTIHGPYEGIRLFSWFQRGWLSLDVLIWSTTKSVTPINVKKFTALHECLNDLR